MFARLLIESVRDWISSVSRISSRGESRLRLELEALENRCVPSATTIPPYTPVAAVPTILISVASQFTHSAEHYRDEVSAGYQLYLGRAPDAAGLTFWTKALLAGASDEKFEARLVSSPEYLASHGATMEDWIDSIYQDVLGRSATTDEVANFIQLLDGGDSHFDVALQLTRSSEHEQDLITSYYQQFLQRTASATDIDYWVNSILQDGSTQEEVQAFFLSSPEYTYTHYLDHYDSSGHSIPPVEWSSTSIAALYLNATGGSVEGWLYGLYHDVLGRTPEAAGYSYWSGQLGAASP
jgi:Domain of unknown function (DUF4214)